MYLFKIQEYAKYMIQSQGSEEKLIKYVKDLEEPQFIASIIEDMYNDSSINNDFAMIIVGVEYNEFFEPNLVGINTQFLEPKLAAVLSHLSPVILKSYYPEAVIDSINGVEYLILVMKNKHSNTQLTTRKLPNPQEENNQDSYLYFDPKELKILNSIRNNNHITIVEMSQETGISLGMVSTVINRLRKSKALVRLGAKRNGEWRIKKEVLAELDNEK